MAGAASLVDAIFLGRVGIGKCVFCVETGRRGVKLAVIVGLTVKLRDLIVFGFWLNLSRSRLSSGCLAFLANPGIATVIFGLVPLLNDLWLLPSGLSGGGWVNRGFGLFSSRFWNCIVVGSRSSSTSFIRGSTLDLFKELLSGFTSITTISNSNATC